MGGADCCLQSSFQHSQADTGSKTFRRATSSSHAIINHYGFGQIQPRAFQPKTEDGTEDNKWVRKFDLDHILASGSAALAEKVDNSSIKDETVDLETQKKNLSSTMDMPFNEMVKSGVSLAPSMKT